MYVDPRNKTEPVILDYVRLSRGERQTLFARIVDGEETDNGQFKLVCETLQNTEHGNKLFTLWLDPEHVDKKGNSRWFGISKRLGLDLSEPREVAASEYFDREAWFTLEGKPKRGEEDDPDATVYTNVTYMGVNAVGELPEGLVKQKYVRVDRTAPDMTSDGTLMDEESGEELF